MKQFVLVAGVDYEEPRQLPKYRPFFRACEARIKEIMRTSGPSEELTFFLFDFTEGKHLKYEIKRDRRKLRPIELPSEWHQITKSSYEGKRRPGRKHFTFKDGQRNKMSIMEVYRNIADLKEASVAELSIFSHAIWNGPILVNSDPDGKDSAIDGSPTVLPGNRDPDDMDARVNFDFEPPNLYQKEIDNFKRAFSPDASIRIWGCNALDDYDSMLGKIERHEIYKKFNGRIEEEELFTITNFKPREAGLFEERLKGYVGEFADKRKIQIEYKWIKFFFCEGNSSCYAPYIASKANVKTHAGVLGTSSRVIPGSWHMQVNQVAYSSHLEFYRKSLNLEIDKFGYGVFLPDYKCEVANKR